MTRRRAIATPDAPPGSVERYRERNFDDGRHDLYQSRRTYKEPTVCARCGDVYERGGWRWGDAPTHAQLEISPACAHSRDKLPAGFITVPGKFFDTHRPELLQLARHAAGQEAAEHPLHRIMHIAETPAGAVITCVIHSARRIGEALKRAYHGDLNIRFGEDEYSMHVDWRR